MICSTCVQDEGNKEYIQNLGREITWKTKGKKYISMDLRKKVCEYGRWMEIALDHVEWHPLILDVLKCGYYYQRLTSAVLKVYDKV